MNLSRPFVINKMKEYLACAEALLTSPYCRAVDYRIVAYIQGFTIAGWLAPIIILGSRNLTTLGV